MRNSTKRIIATLSAFALLAGGFGAYKALDREVVASIIHLDVNPSIELQVDDDAEIIKAVALNQDAEKVLEGMKLKDVDVDTAINAIIGSLLKHGYMNELANSILLTVEDDNTERGAQLKAELTKELDAILGSTALNASVLAQQIEDGGAEELADSLNITTGKATLVKNIVDANGAYKAEDLAELSVNELNLVLSNSKNDVKNVVSTGEANEEAYIGKDKAKEVAFKHAKVDEKSVRELDIEMDFEYGAMVYEVDFASEEFEYDYSIDAKNGEVIHSHKEQDEDYVAPVEEKTVEEKKDNASSTTKKEEKKAEVKDIGKDKAKAIAFEKASVKESNVSKLVVEKEKDDGKYEYHVEFRVGSKEYDVDISAETGKVLDVDDDKKVSSSSATKTEEKKEEKPAEPKDIGKDKAKAIAFDKAGVKESKVSNLVVKKEKDDGKYEYHVDFRVGNKEYDFEISAETGKILDYDVEVEEEKPVEKPVEKEESVTDIGKEKAKSIALSHAGLKESQVTRLEVERDVDDGKVEYSVEFKADGKEYSYEIAGASGKILDYEAERDDD